MKTNTLPIIKYIALGVVCLVAAYLGLTAGMVIGGFGMCASKLDRSVMFQILGVGLALVLVGFAFGKVLSFMPPAVFCLPFLVIGSLFPILSFDWNRIGVTWACVLCIVAAHGLFRGVGYVLEKRRCTPST